jgi:hypothetical protein
MIGPERFRGRCLTVFRPRLSHCRCFDCKRILPGPFGCSFNGHALHSHGPAAKTPKVFARHGRHGDQDGQAEEAAALTPWNPKTT